MLEQATFPSLEIAFNFAPFVKKSVRYSYLKLAEQMMHQDSLSPDEAVRRIREAEEKYHHKLYGIRYSPEGLKEKLYRIRALLVRSILKVISETEVEELDKLDKEFKEFVIKIVPKTDLSRDEVMVMIENIIEFMANVSFEDIENIIVNGLIVEGFSESSEYDLSDEVVFSFLKTSFGIHQLRFSKVGRVNKDNKFLLIMPKNANDDLRQKIQSLIVQGILSQTDAADMLVASDENAYETAAMILEQKMQVSDLEHTYKIRAKSGNPFGFSEIDFHSFAVERPEQFDYLESLKLTDEEKMRVYILGTIAHEIAHRWLDAFIEKTGEQIVLDFYSLLDVESTDEKRNHISDYVVKHVKVYGSKEFDIFQEEFAESVRIYLTNPEWMTQNYNDRFELIKRYLPFLEPGMIISFAKIK